MSGRRNYQKMQALAELQPFIEKARSFSGWTFDELNVVHLDERIPWDYEAIARDAAQNAGSIVDLGTGGGERLVRIVDGVDGRLVATEEWSVNAPVAWNRLHPIGADVVRADSLRLPFGDAAFDLVLDRHEALEPAEVARVLKPGGRVITQQVGHNTWLELTRFVRSVAFPDHFHLYQQGFREAGLRVDEARWHEERVAFRKLGDLVYMIMLTPHEFPDFDPVEAIEDVLDMEEALRTTDGIVLTETHYIIRASKPGRSASDRM